MLEEIEDDGYRLTMQDNLPKGESRYFFSSKDYLSFKCLDTIRIFLFTSTETSAEGKVILYRSEDKFLLPCKAPYGCLELTGEWGDRQLAKVFTKILTLLHAEGAAQVKLQLPSEGIDDNVPVLTRALHRAGFKVAASDIGYHIPTDADYESRLRQDAPRRFKRCVREGYSFEILEKPNLDFIYEFVAQNRAEKSYPLNIEKEELKVLVETFPEQYPIFAVKDGDEIIAVLVAVRASKDILYSFLPADHPKYRSYSPMVFLIGKIVEHCRAEGIKIFDHGIATENGIINEGLALFKKNIGGVASSKPTMYIDLDESDVALRFTH